MDEDITTKYLIENLSYISLKNKHCFQFFEIYMSPPPSLTWACSVHALLTMHGACIGKNCPKYFTNPSQLIPYVVLIPKTYITWGLIYVFDLVLLCARFA